MSSIIFDSDVPGCSCRNRKLESWSTEPLWLCCPQTGPALEGARKHTLNFGNKCQLKSPLAALFKREQTQLDPDIVLVELTLSCQQFLGRRNGSGSRVIRRLVEEEGFIADETHSHCPC